MPACALDKYNKCENFERCKKYCSYKVGESLALMILNIPTVETKMGVQVSSSNAYKNFKYCGVAIDKYTYSTKANAGSTIDIAKENSKFKAFESPFKNHNGMTAAETIEKYVNIVFPNDAGRKGLMDKYYKLVSGKLFPLVITPDEEITMRFQMDGKERQEIGRVESIKWAPDKDTGEIKCTITGETRASGVSISNVYSPEDFSNKVFINKYKLGMKYTLNDNGLIQMMDAGYISPIGIYDGKVQLYLDGHNLILKEADESETILGNFLVNGEFKEFIARIESVKNSTAYKTAKQIIPFVTKFRWFIMPHGMSEDHNIDAHKYLIDTKKSK